jgi:hypothetical protein
VVKQKKAQLTGTVLTQSCRDMGKVHSTAAQRLLRQQGAPWGDMAEEWEVVPASRAECGTLTGCFCRKVPAAGALTTAWLLG